ncbi:MAG: phosphatidate cytidylyltransferase [Bacteroidales bacterium]|nr:phosphatidate cytidylyltransferase [Bacteroidales bacterium]
MRDGKIKKLAVRTISGAVYVALMVSATFCPYLMVPLMLFITIVALIEFYRMAGNPVDKLSRNILIAVAVVVYALTCWQPSFVKAQPLGQPFLMELLLATFVVLSVVEIFRHGEKSALNAIGTDLFAMVWIIIPLYAIKYTCYYHSLSKVILLMFILIWLNDTFAYLGGSLFGRHKMIERISPNKTWEGTITGVLLTMVASLLLGLLVMNKWDDSFTTQWYVWLFFGLMVSVFATMGDLLESLLKRQAGVKDSGKIMPGHGGILDRMDSILLTTYPVLFICGLLLR